MTELTARITVPRSVDDCYRYLLDFSTIEQWDPGVERAEKITPGRPEPGARYALTLRTPTGPAPMHYRLEAAEENSYLEFRGEGAGYTARDRIRFELLEPSLTRIDYRADIRFSGLLERAAPLLQPWLNRLGARAMAGLAEAFEDPTPPYAPTPSDRLSDRLLLPAMRNFTRRGYARMPNRGLNQYMDGKTSLITGPTSGLGLAAACELARLGSRVVLIGRDADRLLHSEQLIRDYSGCGADAIISYAADLSSMAQVGRVARDILRHKPRIDVLINNAGALFAERNETPEGFERALAINLLAPYRLTEALLPALRESQARVINVASGGMYLQGLHLDDMNYEKSPYDGSKAYARCKRALVALTEHWAAQPKNRGVRFYAMHPGWAATPGVAKSLPAFYRRLGKRLRDSRMGADTICWLASTHALEAQHNSLFWFDRRPHPTAVLPNTGVGRRQRDKLVAWLEVSFNPKEEAA